jgi:hypothetical protein
VGGEQPQPLHLPHSQVLFLMLLVKYLKL